jgi:cytochrome c556
MEAMKEIADTMKRLAPVTKSEANWDATVVAASAETIAGHAARMPDLFPDGSVSEASEARPRIWRQWDAFLTDARALENAATALAKAAAENSFADAQVAFGAAGESCKSCHEAFRIKK